LLSTSAKPPFFPALDEDDDDDDDDEEEAAAAAAASAAAVWVVVATTIRPVAGCMLEAPVTVASGRSCGKEPSATASHTATPTPMRGDDEWNDHLTSTENRARLARSEDAEEDEDRSSSKRA
jgi:hypothetical protein